MTALMLLLGALATWRISHMLLRENGPFRVFHRLREALGVEYSSVSDEVVIAFKYEITTCIWCLSMWVGALIGLMIYFLQQYAMYLLMPYAFSAVAIVIDKYFGLES